MRIQDQKALVATSGWDNVLPLYIAEYALRQRVEFSAPRLMAVSSHQLWLAGRFTGYEPDVPYMGGNERGPHVAAGISRAGQIHLRAAWQP